MAGTTSWSEVTFWALDLECSGLDPTSDCIVSVGMVPVRQGTVRWGERYYSLVRSSHCPAPSVDALVIHGILPEQLADAPAETAVLARVAERLESSILLVHHAALDVAFLRCAFRRDRRRWPRPPVVDTARLIRRLNERRHRLDPYAEALPQGLDTARTALGLPPHPRHHALTDAVATAELFLALRHRLEIESVEGLVEGGLWSRLLRLFS